MASTYIAHYPEVTWATTKTMAYVLNASGSGKIVRIYRIWMQSYSTTAVTGVYHTVELRRFTAVNGTPTAVTPLKYDTNSAALPAQITAGYAGTYPMTGSVTTGIRQIVFSDEVPAVGTAINWVNLQSIVPWSLIWNGGYGDNSVGVEPFTLREGEGLAVDSTAASGTAAGNIDVYIEFTAT